MLTPFDKRRRRRKAPRPGSVAMPRIVGNLAMLAAPATMARVSPSPALRRLLREKHPALGFRFADALYLYSLARQVLTQEEAYGWAYLMFCDPWGAQHAQTVLDLLAPGQEASTAYPQLLDQVRQAYAGTVDAGIASVIGAGEDTPERAQELQAALEDLYEQEGWQLPGIPLGLMRYLYDSDILPKGY